MSYLVNPYMVSPATVPMIIPSISGEYWHYDFAGEQSVITMDGSSRVSKVTNGFSTGTSRDLLQGTSGAQPLFIANDTNGLGVCDFSGDRYMLTGDIGTLSQPFTVFSAQQFLTYPTQSSLTVDGRVLANRLNHCNHYAVDGCMLNCGANLANVGNATDNENHVVTSIVNGSSSSNRVDTIASTGNAGSGAWDGVSVGTNSAHLSGFWNAKIMEVVCYDVNVNDPADLASIEDYLMDRWGIT